MSNQTNDNLDKIKNCIAFVVAVSTLRMIIDVDNSKTLRTVSKNSLVVQASFYGDIVVFASDAEGHRFDPQPGQMVYRIFHVCDIYFDRRLKTKCFVFSYLKLHEHASSK